MKIVLSASEVCRELESSFWPDLIGEHTNDKCKSVRLLHCEESGEIYAELEFVEAEKEIKQSRPIVAQ